MTRLLLLACGIASAICLDVLAGQADAAPTTFSQPSHYSRPTVDGILADDKKTQCLRGCDNNNQQCMSQHTALFCINLRQHCQQECNRYG